LGLVIIYLTQIFLLFTSSLKYSTIFVKWIIRINMHVIEFER
jgi:hypothetical protein